MSEDCAGDHVCDCPDASGPGLVWTCPECGREYESFCLDDGTLLPSITAVLVYHGKNLSALHGWRGRVK